MDAKKVGIAPFIFSVSGVIALEAGACGFLEGLSHGHPEGILALRLAQTLWILAVVSLFPPGLSAIGLSRPGMGHAARRGAVWSVCLGGAALGVLAAGFVFQANWTGVMRMRLPQEPEKVFFYFLASCVAGPFVEEMFFRGLVYGFFRRWGVMTATAASVFLFVAAHAFSGMAPRAAGGIVFALSYEKERNLMAPVVIHILGNMVVFSFSFFSLFFPVFIH
jgi:uncharacterized protein